MKLIMAIIQNDDERVLIGKLTEAGYRVTKLASTGGFLKLGNTTIMIGVEDNELSGAVEIIKKTCQTRNVTLPSYPYAMEAGVHITYPVQTKVGGATIFVMPVDQKISV